MFFCGLSATLVAFRLGALPALVRRSSGVVGGGRAIRGSSFRFPFPFRASRRAPGGKVRSWWAPREPSRAGGLGRVAGVRLARWRRANRGPVTVVRGPPGGGGFRGRAGRRGLGRRGFPRRRVSFALFARKSKLTNSVVFASFLIRRGPHALYRKPVFRPRTAALFSRRRGPFLPRRGPFSGPPPAAPAPRPPRPGARRRAQDPLSHFALQKSDRRGQLSRFALQKSDQRGRLFHFALQKSDRHGWLSRFALQKSDWRGQLSRFALQKSDRRGRLFHFALQKSRRPGPGGPRIPGVES